MAYGWPATAEIVDQLANLTCFVSLVENTHTHFGYLCNFFIFKNVSVSYNNGILIVGQL